MSAIENPELGPAGKGGAFFCRERESSHPHLYGATAGCWRLARGRTSCRYLLRECQPDRP